MDTTVPDNIPWYKSNIIRSLLISTLAQILARFHVTASFAPDSSKIADTILDLISLAAGAYAAYSRAKHPLPALTTTQTKADEANGVLNAKSKSVPDNVPSPAASAIQPISGTEPDAHTDPAAGSSGSKP